MIITESLPTVHAFRACRLVRIGRESAGAKISVVIADNKGGEQTVFLFPSEVLSGYARFQRGVLRAGGIHFDNATFSTGLGRARRWAMNATSPSTTNRSSAISNGARNPIEYDRRIRVLPSYNDDERGIGRLRSLPKAMARSWRLRCVLIVVVGTETPSGMEETE